MGHATGDDLSLGGLRSVAEAIAILDAAPLERIVAIDVELSRPEEQMTPGNVLARDVVADRDHPPFDKALVDGFAVRAADLAAVPAELRVLGEVAAGATADALHVGPGTAVAVMTGAPVPPGADAMVPVEHATLGDEGRRVRIERSPKAGGGIARQGADARAGQLVLPAGTRIGPAQLAALATVGATRVPVSGDPIAHVLVTGDELVDAADTPAGAQVRDANGPMLVALLRHLSCLPGMSRVGDGRETIRKAIDHMAAEADVLLVSGGMSMGRHDHVPGVLGELGFDLRITKLLIQPGKPFVFATRTRPGKTDYVFGLPGNPVSAYVCTLRFASRVIARLRGLSPGETFVPVRLAADLLPNGRREFHQPATLDDHGTATPLPWRGSADVFTLARADVLIVRPIDDPARGAGEVVRAILLPR